MGNGLKSARSLLSQCRESCFYGLDWDCVVMGFEDNCLWFMAQLNYYALGTHWDVHALASAVALFLIETVGGIWKERRGGGGIHRQREFARESGPKGRTNASRRNKIIRLYGISELERSRQRPYRI